MRSALLLPAAILWLLWVAALLVFGRRPELRIGGAAAFVFPLAALAVVLAWWLVGPASPWSPLLWLYLRAAVVVAAWLVLVWLASLVLRDASIMDIAYPLSASLPVAALIAMRGSWSAHELFMLVLVALWSLRLAGHIAWRNLGRGEDRRYAAWRTRFGAHWWWWSFFQVFATQGVLVWLWSAPLVLALAAAPATLGWQHVLASGLFGLGFAFEAGGDWQLAQFRKHRSDNGAVLDTGFWSLSRHPNYFGEAMVWWSFGALALVHPWGWVALLSPLYVTWFMGTGSATPMQERYLQRTKPAYAAYMRRVPKFFPWSSVP